VREALSFFFLIWDLPCYNKIGHLLICRTIANTKQSSNTFKQKRQEEKKASEASGNTQSWNTLFMRPDTVCTLSNIINGYPSFFCLLERVRSTGDFIVFLHVYILVRMLLDFSVFL